MRDGQRTGNLKVSSAKTACEYVCSLESDILKNFYLVPPGQYGNLKKLKDDTASGFSGIQDLQIMVVDRHHINKDFNEIEIFHSNLTEFDFKNKNCFIKNAGSKKFKIKPILKDTDAYSYDMVFMTNQTNVIEDMYRAENF